MPPNLVSPHNKPHEAQLLHYTWDARKLELLALEVDVAAPHRLCSGLELALLFLVLLLLRARVAVRPAVWVIDVQVDLEIGPEAFGAAVLPWQGDVLRGEDGDSEIEGLVGDGRGGGLGNSFKTLICILFATVAL